MCGIFGLITPGRPVDLSSAFDGIQALRHRGPDGLGIAAGRLGDGTLVFQLNPAAPAPDPSAVPPDVFLGHRRLSIIDLSDAAYQPLTNEDGSVWVVFNGEIYNHAPLRAQLEQTGHRFRTDHSDTEVLVHGYEEWGDGLVDRLNGMFAFAVVDLRRREALLARDPFGEKPLYLAAGGGTIAFASELRALVAAGAAGHDISTPALADFVRFGYVPAPGAILGGISKLRSAEAVRLRLDGPVERRRWRYWTPRYAPEPVRDLAAWDEEFRDLLGRSVRARFMTDVPLGAYLSGGLDSATVVRFLRDAALPSRRTFNIAFPGTAADEGPAAAAVAARYGTTHESMPMSAAGLLELLPAFGDAFDEPFADPSALPSFALARMTRQRVTVAVSGDGGDELFGGYARYALQLRLSRLFDRPWGAVAAPVGRWMAGRWPERLRGRGVAELIGVPPQERYERAMSDASLLARSSLAGQAAFAFEGVWDEGTPTLLQRMRKADLLLYLPEDLTVKVDRTAMQVGLEVRAPLLDRELFDFVGRAPDHVLRKGRRTKLPLRRLLEPELGAHLVNRPKHGFSVPLERWFRRELREPASDLLEAPGSFVQTVVPRSVVSALLAEHRRGLRNHGHRLWRLLALEVWHRRFGRNRPAGRDFRATVAPVSAIGD